MPPAPLCADGKKGGLPRDPGNKRLHFLRTPRLRRLLSGLTCDNPLTDDMTTRRKFIRTTAASIGGLGLIGATPLRSLAALEAPGRAVTAYVDRFRNENHPEIGYWFFSPSQIPSDGYLDYLDKVVMQFPFTLVFLTAREGADFYDYARMRPVFSKLVAAAHRRGLKIGLQLWQDEKQVSPADAVRMLVDHELTLDATGSAVVKAAAQYIRFPERLLKTDLFKAYAFRKTGEGFYAPGTLKDITHLCHTTTPDKQTVEVSIRGTRELAGLTAYVVTQQYCLQSSFFGLDEYRRYADAIDAYSDIPFDGFALDEYGYKFIERFVVDVDKAPDPAHVFRGRWYSDAMAEAFRRSGGGSLTQTLLDGRYAPEGKPEVRMKAINVYMDFMRGGALIIENGIYHKSREVFGTQIFNGIHDTYHNSLVNDEIWANGISWWKLPRAYGQTDEMTPTPVQLGIAMAHRENAMYNQFYGHTQSALPVVEKALSDLTYGVRTHYHAMNDKRENRYDLAQPEGIDGVNRVERCARILNKFNPRLPQTDLVVIFGIEALANWYPDHAVRGVYDINEKMGVKEKCVELWNAGYVHAVMPSDLIATGQLTLDALGRPSINGHTFKAVVYLNPQYAKEPEIAFLEHYVAGGGRLMIEGTATHDFQARDISGRFQALYRKATVRGYSLEGIAKLGVSKNKLAGGCRTEDQAYVFTDIDSLLHEHAHATFTVDVGGHTYTGSYKGLAVMSFDEKGGVRKLGATGLTELKRDAGTLISFSRPVDVFYDTAGREPSLVVADPARKITPVVNKLF